MPDVDQLADQVLGFDATPDQVTVAASVLAELVRRLNHATRAANLTPQEVDRVVVDLGRAVGMLPQLFRQLGQRIAAHDNSGRLAAAGDRPAAEVARAARMFLGYAEGDVERGLAQHLNLAQQETSRLYLDG